MKRKNVLAIILILALMTGLVAGCGGSNSDEPSSAPTVDSESNNAVISGEESLIAEGESTLTRDANGRIEQLNIGIDMAPSDLTPWASIGGGHSYMMPVVYEFLGEKNTNAGELELNLMKSYEAVDALTYNITIWDGISDAAGNPFTASDVAYSILAAKEDRKINPAVYVDTIDVTSDTTLTVKFTTDQYGLFELLVSQVPMCTQAAYEASSDGFATYPVTTAPYQVTNYTAGSSITMELRDDYWQSEENYSPQMKTNVQKMVFKVITEPAQMSIALETGDIDMAQFVTTEELGNFLDGGAHAGEFSVFPQENFLTQNIQFNMSGQSVFSNSLELREAVCYAIDAQAVIDGSVTTMGGSGMNAFGARVYSDYQSEWDNQDYFSYDPDKAQQLIQESGVSASELSNIRIITINTNTYTRMAQIIAAYLGNVGITATVDTYDQALFNTMIYDPSAYDISIMGNGSSDGRITTFWRLVLDARQFENGTMNFIHDDELQNDLETVVTTEGYSAELINKISEHLNEEAYVYGLFNQRLYIVAKPDCKDIRLSYFGYVCPNACTFE